MHQHSDKPELEKCIQHCLHCHHICLETAMNHCLPISGMEIGHEHFRSMVTCAEICRRGATSCRTIGGMDDCVRTCEDCAASCSQRTA